MTNTHIQRGGRYYELNLQLHSKVANPYIFNPKQNYKSSSDIKAAVPAYTEKSWTTPGTYTWTVPDGVTKIRVAICGGGGGGTRTRSKVNSCTNGETSNLYINDQLKIFATGGSRISYTDFDGVSTYYSGTSGKPNPLTSGLGYNLTFNKQQGNYGKGSSVKHSNFSNHLVYGGSGGYDTNYFNVIKDDNIKIIVGNKGSNQDAAGVQVYNTSGFVLIAYGQGIE